MQIQSGPQASKGAVPSRRKFSISAHVVPGLILVLDSVVILSAALVSYFALVADRGADPGFYTSATAFVWLTTALLMNFAGLYHLEPIMRPLVFADKIAIAFATTILFLLAAAFSLKISADFSRVWISTYAMGACAATILVRVLASFVLRRLTDNRVFTRNVVIAGAGEQARKLLVRIEESRPRFISVLGVFAAGSDELHDLGRYPTLGKTDDLNSYLRTHDVDDVIVALPWSADEQILAMMGKLRELPVNVYLGSDLIGFRLPFRPPPDHFGEIPLVEVMGRPLAGWGAVLKAAEDYCLAAILTVVLLPLMALIAIIVKLDSKGPALFRQQRFGFVNQVFYIYKFRTMKHQAVSEKETVQASRDDPRVTRIGRFLRRTSLDELPQLFNVLNGTMSLVGPRPHAVDHNETYSQMIRGYFARHRVKPGLTGWAQVNGLRGETKTVDDMEARVNLDVYYAENWSLLLDLKILAMTAVICITGRNAY